jgi:alpha-N-arabinofuranosidase
MANIAQMVNVLQAMILTDGPRMTLTPTYHAFEMYVPFQGATYLPTEIQAPGYSHGEFSVPAVTVTAARDTSGRLQYGLVNLDPKREAVVTTTVSGAAVKGASGRVLTAKNMDAHNTVDQPHAVKPEPIKARTSGNKVVLRLPPKSVTVVELR